MKNKVVLTLCILALLLLNIYSYSVITSLLRQPSDSSVLSGLLIALALVAADILLIKKMIRS